MPKGERESGGVGVIGRVEIERARSYQDFDVISLLMLVHGYVYLIFEYAVLSDISMDFG